MNTTIAALYWWVCWLVIGFGVPETLALVTGHPEYTFSETVWRGLDVLPGQTIVQWNLLHGLACLACLAIAAHLMFRVWP